MKLCSHAVLAAALLAGFGVCSIAQAVDVDVNVNVKHSVGGIDSFDRSKFITLHNNHDNGDWLTDNVLPDLMDDFLNGNDVYFGRNTGYISWYMNNETDEDPDPAKSGWPRLSGSYYSIESRGQDARSTYNGKTWAHAYANRAATDIMCAQYHPFWPDGTLTARGWALSQTDTGAEPFGSATGYFMGQFMTNFYANSGNSFIGPPQPAYVEVINEPGWELWGWDPPNDATEIANAEKLWKFHNSVAEQIKSINGEHVKVGGYCTAFPDHENSNFLEWDREWKAYIDNCGSNLDFYAIHFYDFNENESTGDGGGNTGGYQRLYRRGSNIEATLDMIEHYSDIALGEPKPFVVSEYGGRARNLESGAWSEHRDWQTIKSISSMMMSFADRPHLMHKTIPFIMLKEEWAGTTPTSAHSWRLMRRQNEPASFTGDWTYTEMVKLYRLWSEVNGARVDITSDDPDVQIDAYVDGDRTYVILNNLGTAAKTVDLNMFEANGNTVSSVLEKSLYWGGTDVALDETLHAGNIAQVSLPHEGTVILRYTFASPVVVDETKDEVKYYASTYYQEIYENWPTIFQINGVGKGVYGEAVLRLGMGRAATASKEPIVLVNGVEVTVIPDFMGHEGDERSVFFGQLNIPIPYDLLQENNSISVMFTDDGGYISSVALRVFEFSSDVRGTGPVWSPEGSVITSYETVGSDFVLGITNGFPDGYFDLLASDDLPGSNWTYSLIGQQFDSAGEATVTNPITEDYEFFRVRETEFPTVPVTGVSVSPASDALTVGQTVQLTATVAPPNASNLSVTWSSDTPAVATVDGSGLVDAVSAGTATITATTVDGGFTDTSVITVSSAIAATFDWSDTAGYDKWDMLSYSETDNGVTMTTSGRITTDDTQPYAIKFAYDNAAHDHLPGNITMEQGGGAVNFIVTSIDISQVAGTSAGTTKYVQGRLGTNVLWEIIAPEDGVVRTYTSPTTGDMGFEIDSIVWHAGWIVGSGYGYESTIDNLSVSVPSP